jgi:hypothetical protein
MQLNRSQCLTGVGRRFINPATPNLGAEGRIILKWMLKE